MLGVIDAGARYGPHPTWVKLFKKDLVEIHAFEPEPKEYNVLVKKYGSQKNFFIMNEALGESEGKLKLNILSHNGQTSNFKPAIESHWFNNHRPNDKEIVGEYEAKKTTIDAYVAHLIFNNIRIPNFIKTDTEGYDLSILKGASKTLEHIYAIRTEVNFQSVWEGAPLFSKIFEWLREKDYELINIDYNGQGIPYSYFAPEETRFGQICGTEAIFMKPISYIKNMASKEVLKVIVFLYNNNCQDIAHYLLCHLSENNHRFTYNSEIEMEILIQFLLSSKKFENKPTNQFITAKNDYEKIFEEKYPSQHNFYNKLHELEEAQKMMIAKRKST